MSVLKTYLILIIFVLMPYVTMSQVKYNAFFDYNCIIF